MDITGSRVTEGKLHRASRSAGLAATSGELENVRDTLQRQFKGVSV